MILLDLVQNIALLVALSAVLPFVAKSLGRGTVTGQVLIGLLFGGVTLVGMLTPVDIGGGVIFDGRSIVLCAAGVVGGPVVAGVAAAMAVAYRVYLGGGGAIMGVSVALEAAVIGTAVYYLRRRGPEWTRPRTLLVIGYAVHIVMVVLMSTLPGAARGAALNEIIVVVLTLYPLATAAVCWFLLEDEGRIATREALVVSEERLKRAVEGSNTGLWDWNVKTDLLDINDTWAEMIGRTPADLAPITGSVWRSLIHPDDLERIDQVLALHLAGTTPFYLTEFRMRHEDGSWVWVTARGTVVDRDAAGTPVRMTGAHIDISARKAAEEALRVSHAKMEQMVLDVAEAMGRVVEARDPYTQGHEQRVAVLARAIADRMGLSEDEADGIEMAGMLHDVGKLHVPAEILTKPGKLSDAEFALIREHPQNGNEILKDIAFPWPIAEIVLQHHERMDGSGYPNALSGDEITLPARILAVADVVEAMASHRPYRPALGIGAAIAEVRDAVGKYDPRAVAACLSLHSEGMLGL